MTAEEFYDENYKDPNHFYVYVRGIALASPKKIQQAMEDYAEQELKDVAIYIKDSEAIKRYIDEQDQRIKEMEGLLKELDRLKYYVAVDADFADDFKKLVEKNEQALKGE